MTRRHAPIRCHDGFCAADDCPTCHPSTWRSEFEDAESEARLDEEPDDSDPVDRETQMEVGRE